MEHKIVIIVGDICGVPNRKTSMMLKLLDSLGADVEIKSINDIPPGKHNVQFENIVFDEFSKLESGMFDRMKEPAIYTAKLVNKSNGPRDKWGKLK